MNQTNGQSAAGQAVCLMSVQQRDALVLLLTDVIGEIRRMPVKRLVEQPGEPATPDPEPSGA